VITSRPTTRCCIAGSAPEARRGAGTPLLALLPLLALAGCASLSERECRDGDWYQIGLEDGFAGREPGRLSAHADACAEYGIVPDAAQYRAGRDDGLVQFCTTTRGFETGRQGYSYAGVCPASREPAFLRGYDLGRRFHDVDSRLARIDSDLGTYRSQLSGKDLEEKQRRRLESLLRNLELERSRLEDERRRLEWEFRRL